MKKKLKRILYKPYSLYKKIVERKKYQKYVENLRIQIKNLKKDEKKVWYFCAAIHENLGDLAQRYCIEKWIEENYHKYKLVVLPTKSIEYIGKKIVGMISEKMNSQDIIVFQSGYTMSDIHPDDNIRLLIMNNFKNNQYIIFPQTVLYTKKKKIKKMQKAFLGIKKLKLIARDSISQENIKKYFGIYNSELYPDIVTTLIGTKKYENKRDGICVCVRNDGEKYYSDKIINELIMKLKSIDQKIDLTDTNCSNLPEVSFSIIEKEIFKKIDEFSKYKVIITDRFHGTIFSLISGTRVIVIKTNDHKVSTGINWFKGIYDENVKYCDNIEDVPLTVKQYYKINKNSVLEPYFKKMYYDKLKSNIGG